MANPRKRVLLIAYACEPGKGSEPGVGWHWARHLAQRHDVTVVTRTNNREAIDRELVSCPQQGLSFVYVEAPAWLRWVKNGQRGLYAYYFAWQFSAGYVCKKLAGGAKFDVVHSLTFGSFLLPACGSSLGRPFVWGPVGGGEGVPTCLVETLTARWRFYEWVRRAILLVLPYMCPWFRMTGRRAAAIIARTRISRDYLRRIWPGKVSLMLETGVSVSEVVGRQATVRQEGVVVMAGRLQHFKGMHLGIMAFAKVAAQFPQATMLIVGSGPCRHELESLVQVLGICDRVRFMGAVSHDVMMQTFDSAAVFLQPSLRDAGSWVMFEAMERELPCVYLDHAGPGEIADETCGVRVALGRKSVVVDGLAVGLARLLANKELAVACGRASRRRLLEFHSWRSRIEGVSRIYAELCGDAGACESGGVL